MGSRRNLLAMSWVDADGTPYHEAEVSPSVARHLLARNHVADFRCDGVTYPAYLLSAALIRRSSRGATAKLPYPPERTVLITLATDKQGS
jgi:hypothetical protein